MVMGFASFGNFVSHSAFGILRSVFGKLPPADFNTSQSVLTFGPPSPQNSFVQADRYINYTVFHNTPVNCYQYLPFMS